MPWELPFAEISEHVNRAIVNEQQQHREHADALHRSLTRSSVAAESLDDIIQEFARLIGHPVVLEDVDGIVLAAAPAEHPGSASSSRVMSPNVGIPGMLQSLVREGYWSNIHNSQNASRVIVKEGHA